MASSRNPTTWDEYEGRQASLGRSGSVSSGHRSVHFEDEGESLLRRDSEAGPYDDGSDFPRLRRRRSSVGNRLAALGDLGGVNSIRSFTKSWQRAAGFAEVIPQRPAFVFAPDQEGLQYGRSDVETGRHGHASLLRQQLNESAVGDDGLAEPSASQSPFLPPADYREREQKALDSEPARSGLGPGLGLGLGLGLSHSGSMASFTAVARPSSLFATPPHLATPMVGSYGSSREAVEYVEYLDYGSVDRAVDRTTNRTRTASMATSSTPSMREAAALWEQRQAGGNVPDGQGPAILVKEVEQDGKLVLTVDGQSTLPQTVFNSINVLIGVGLLSLPLGIKYAGWLCGLLSLVGCALLTAYTARLLTKCMDLDRSLITFSDVAYISFGRNARVATSLLFTLELLAACVALIVLFADSLNALFPAYLSVFEWKLLCSLLMIPLNFLPLRLLSFTSVIGILSCFGIVTIILVDGFLKPDSPGSLIEPAKTYLLPANWLTLPLSFGLLMSPWGGHSVFPNIYRDMRHPHRFKQAIKITFSFTYLLDAVTAVAGVLMFGDSVRDEITSNILACTAYPKSLTFLMCTFIAIIPLTKIPLNSRPIISTLEVLLGLHQQTVAETASLIGRSATCRGAAKVLIRVGTVLCFLAMSVAFPAFDSIMAFMGSALCFSICVTLPLAFYLKLFGHEISAREKTCATAVMCVSIVLSVVGTVWAFLPKSLIGAE